MSSRTWALARCAAVIAGLTALPGRAAAAPAGASPPVAGLTVHGEPGRRIAVDTPVARAAPFAAVSPVLYLNRCTGNCTVRPGDNDARNHVSSIPSGSSSMYTINEFAVGMVTGAGADATWAQVVTCMKEVYAPYNITVTDVQPPAGTGYNEAIIAGSPDQLGQPQNVLGVAPLASDCSAIDNVISFSFANEHAGTGMDLVYNICWTAAQESAHAYGLDHEFTFTSGNVANDHSACNDPMTYRTDCGGEKFFRNQTANCGETANRACHCGATQNSHAKVLSVFGASPVATIVAAPTAQILELNNGDLLSTAVAVAAGAQRGVARIDLYFNGFKWAETPGAPFAMRGQPNPSNYAIPVPAALPNSVVDVKAIAYDDLGASTESATVTVTKGAACTNASSCAKGQKCETGKCFWDPPSGEIGASCAYPQFCKSGLCTGTADQQICTQSCIPDSADSCPSGFECLMSGPGTGVCFFSTTGGCCSVDRGGSAWWLPVSLGLVVLGLVARPRRRRR
ncbi:MAG TPA: hypothetical protein VHW23_46250 [Kofleriaceae bacterium]|nr:hypothetical protein [Kofleriaceae bacterium]